MHIRTLCMLHVEIYDLKEARLRLPHHSFETWNFRFLPVLTKKNCCKCMQMSYSSDTVWCYSSDWSRLYRSHPFHTYYISHLYHTILSLFHRKAAEKYFSAKAIAFASCLLISFRYFIIAVSKRLNSWLWDSDFQWRKREWSGKIIWIDHETENDCHAEL